MCFMCVGIEHVFRVLWIYATMETRLGVHAAKAWLPKGVLIDSALLAFFFISITC